MISIRSHAFIEIRLIEIIRPRDVHVVETSYLEESVSTTVGKSNLSPGHLRCGDLGSAAEA